MNQLPYETFSVIELVTTFTLERNLKGYKEVSNLDVYRVLSNGYVMFAVTQRSGDTEWKEWELKNVAQLTPHSGTVKEIIDLWKALFMSGAEDEVEVPGTYHRQWSDTILASDLGENLYRIQVKGATTGKEVGFIYCINNYRMGIIRSEKDACVTGNIKLAIMMGTSCLLSTQLDTFHDTVAYLVDAYSEDMQLVVQKNVGERSWVDVYTFEDKLIANNRFNKEAFIKSIQ